MDFMAWGRGCLSVGSTNKSTVSTSSHILHYPTTKYHVIPKMSLVQFMSSRLLELAELL
jgi:hypothetical protein